MQKKFLLPLLLSFLFLNDVSVYAQGQEEVNADSIKTPEEHRFGFIDINAYYDTRKASTLTINYLAILNKHLSYFSFINFQQADPGGVENLTNLNFFYSEHNLTYTPVRKIPIDLNVQLVLVSLPNSTKLRLAPSLRVHNIPVIDKLCKAINLSYGINFHVVQLGNKFPLNDFTWQMEHFYRIEVAPKLLKNHIYISGFADHTMGGPMSKGLVMEHQVGVRIFDQFYAVAEFRHFSYYKNFYPDKQGGYVNGWGLGVEYLVLFK